MHASECRSHAGEEERGCVDHGQIECLCDVQPLARGVPIRSIPNARRLLELGLSRHAFTIWAEEVAARHDSRGQLRLAADFSF
jgi:hypothetical protein